MERDPAKDSREPDRSAEENPLASNSARAWEQVFEALGPASLLIVAEDRMSARLRERLSPEDLVQDAWLHVWRDRERIDWRGIAAFRAYFLRVLDHRIHDAADREGALRRGGELEIRRLELALGGESEGDRPRPLVTTTPSRVALHRERADAMRAALESLPEELREVVRLRLFEELELKEIAARLGIGLSATKHRFRKGATLYQERLERELVSRSPGNSGLA